MFEGSPAWVASGDTGFPDERPRGVRLLPYFDAYTIASQPRELLFPGVAYERALAGGRPGTSRWCSSTGPSCGVWHQRRSGRRIAVTVEPVGNALKTAARRRELERQAERVGEILQGRAELKVGRVTVGPHA